MTPDVVHPSVETVRWMLERLLTSLYRRWRLRSLSGKLLIPIIGLMLISLLGSTLAFVAGTMLTQNQLIQQQIAADAERILDGMANRVGVLTTATVLLANDPNVIAAVQHDDAEALSVLNDRAVVIRDRFGLDLIQIYDGAGQARTNLVVSSLYRESALLGRLTEGEPVVRIVEGRVLLLNQDELPGGIGTVIVGIDLETELNRLVSEYRLSSDVGLSVHGVRIGTREGLPFDEPGRGEGGRDSQRLEMDLGATTVELLVVRPTSGVQHVATTGLAVMIGSTILTTLLLVALSVAITRSIARPVQVLSSAAERVAKGNLGSRVNLEHMEHPLGIGSDDEIGRLAQVFDDMVVDLHGLYQDLESKVGARTRELATAAEVARAVSSSLRLDLVLHTSIRPIHERLGFQHVGLFLLEPDTDSVVLRESTGPVLEPLKAQQFRLGVGSKTIVGAAAAMGEPQIVQYVALEPVYLRVPELPDSGSAAAIPLQVSRNVIGVLYTQFAESNRFTPDVVNLLVTLADQIAIGVENTHLYESEQRRRHLTELLELTGRTLSRSLDLQQVPERVLSLLQTLVPYEQGSLLMMEGQIVKPLAHHGFSNGERAETIEVPIQEGGVFHRMIEGKKPIVLDDVTQEPGWIQVEWLPLHRSWLGVPILPKGEVIGMVSLTRREAGAFTQEDVRWVEAFARQAGIALENASLYAEIAQFNEQLEQMVRERTEQLNRAYQVLEKLDQSKSKFISVAAHELRTPLTVVKGYAQLLTTASGGDLSPHVVDGLEGILSGAERMHEIINSMLDVAKIDNQTLQMSMTTVRLARLIESVCARLAADLQERRLSLNREGLEELPEIQADPELLFKAFYQVIVNAIKYTPDGGSIVVSGSVQAAETPEPFVEVVVSDTGIGIDHQHLELIFEKFYQTGEVSTHSSGRAKYKGGGPGLGLAIARGIVLAHGGRIWAESAGCDEETCPGSQFTIQLPLRLDVERRSAMPIQEMAVPV
ncbi:MAG: GAF domain-containing protein [Anaerolineae bacterium]|nr:GAF domain-containing protein [Anaerolineae bacterium]